MKTVISRDIELAAMLLKSGSPVVFPTETVYGLGAPISNEEAIRKVFFIKNRPSDNPLIVHISSIEQATLLAKNIPQEFYLLAKKYWPGPLTIVLEQKGDLSPLISAGHPTVALRMPSHPIALSLINAVNTPLVAPSANLSGRPSPTSASDAIEDLDGRVECILDGGPCEIGIESTVISLASHPPILLRPGSIPKEELEKTLGISIDLPTTHTKIYAPGMKYRHYAPKARIRLCYDRSEIRGTFVLSLDPKLNERHLSAKTIYALFREADRLGVDLIEIDCSNKLQQDAALFNRIKKAAEN